MSVRRIRPASGHHPLAGAERPRGPDTRYEHGHPDAATLDPQLTASPGGLPLIDNG